MDPDTSLPRSRLPMDSEPNGGGARTPGDANPDRSTPSPQADDSPLVEASRRVVDLARQLFDAPIALATIWTRSAPSALAHVGLEGNSPTPLFPLCRGVADRGEIVVIENWHRDGPSSPGTEDPDVDASGAGPRESDDASPPPTFGGSRVRFYAGTPIPALPHGTIGSLSVLGHRPRPVSPSQRRDLERLAGLLGGALHGDRRASLFDAAFASPEILAWTLARDGSIQTVNDAALDAVGASREDVVGRKIWNGPWWRHNPIERDSIIEHVRAAVHTGTHRGLFSCTHLRPNGEFFATRSTVCPVRRSEGDVTGLVLLSFETTETRYRIERLERQRLAVSRHLHQAEEELLRARDRVTQATDELESRTRMLATLSHEVRTPLTSVIGFANTIVSDLSTLADHGPAEGQTTAEVLATLAGFGEMIEQSGKRLLSVLDGVLTHSKLQVGRLDLSLRMLDASAEARTVAAEMKPHAETAGVDLAVTCPASVPVWADPDGLQIILRNLVSNAIKYTHAGGMAEIRISSEDGAVILEVEDSGIGMEPDDVPELLQSFRRGKSAFVGEREGVGLGLSIVQQIVAELNGDLAIETAPGRGTTVTVRLAASMPDSAS